MSQAQDLHRALLRPSIIHILRAAGFHSTRPSVLDTLTNVAERYLLLLASTTAQHAMNSHNDPLPSVTDLRMALTECGVLIPTQGGAEEEWKELMRMPIEEMGRALPDKVAGERRMAAEKRKREEEDLKDIRDFTKWYSGSQHNEIKRVAGMIPDASAASQLPAVGVGGGVVHADDFLAILKKKYHGGKAGVADENSRLADTVLGKSVEERQVLLEGGPVQRIADWKPKPEDRPRKKSATEEIVVANSAAAESPLSEPPADDHSIADVDMAAATP